MVEDQSQSVLCLNASLISSSTFSHSELFIILGTWQGYKTHSIPAAWNILPAHIHEAVHISQVFQQPPTLLPQHPAYLFLCSYYMLSIYPAICYMSVCPINQGPPEIKTTNRILILYLYLLLALSLAHCRDSINVSQMNNRGRGKIYDSYWQIELFLMSIDIPCFLPKLESKNPKTHQNR